MISDFHSTLRACLCNEGILHPCEIPFSWGHRVLLFTLLRFWFPHFDLFIIYLFLFFLQKTNLKKGVFYTQENITLNCIKFSRSENQGDLCRDTFHKHNLNIAEWTTIHYLAEWRTNFLASEALCLLIMRCNFMEVTYCKVAGLSSKNVDSTDRTQTTIPPTHT